MKSPISRLLRQPGFFASARLIDINQQNFYIIHGFFIASLILLHYNSLNMEAVFANFSRERI